MFELTIALHVIICALLILLVLVQQGRGGGLISSFSSAESVFGTKTNDFLVKATSVLATAFFFTCLILAFLSLQKGKSLIDTKYHPEAMEETLPEAAAAASGVEETGVLTEEGEPTSPSAVPVETPQAPAASEVPELPEI